MRVARMARPATPPTAPPTIAPVFELEVVALLDALIVGVVTTVSVIMEVY